MNKKKVAICMSGHLRRWDKAVRFHLKNIIFPLSEKYEVDLFISTWDKTNSLDSYYAINHRFPGLDPTDIPFREIYSIYDPTKINVLSYNATKKYFWYENFITHKLNLNTFPVNTVVVNGILISAAQSLLMADCYTSAATHNIYDFYVRLRPDFGIDRNVFSFWNERKDCVLVNKIYLTEETNQPYAVGDVFAILPSEFAPKYFNIFSQIKKSISKYDSIKFPYIDNQENIKQCGLEQILYREFIDNNIPFNSANLEFVRAE